MSPFGSVIPNATIRQRNPIHLRHSPGFTLVEVLVALVLLGFVFALINEALRFGWQSRAASLRIETMAAEQEAVTHTLRSLLAGASPGDPRNNQAALIGSARSISFVGRLPDGFGAAATQEADVTLRMGDGNTLELLWRPHYRRWIAAPSPYSRQVLLSGLSQLDLGFQGGASSQWASVWSASELPRLVRIRLLFPAGDARHWPDFVAAPMRQAMPR